MTIVETSRMPAFARPMLSGPVLDPHSWLDWLESAFAVAPQRFLHLQTVWQRAARLGSSGCPWLDESSARRLELAALLHDVGRAVDPYDSHVHGFVGAGLLDAVGLSDVARLVAHHSGAQREAAMRGLAQHDRWSDDEPQLLLLLNYLDRTTSPTGALVTLAERREELAHRLGAASREVQIFDAMLPQLSETGFALEPFMDEAVGWPCAAFHPVWVTTGAARRVRMETYRTRGSKPGGSHD